MQAVLVMFRSDGERRSFSLTRDVTVIGRREDCELRIPLGEVSRKHCRIVHEDGLMRLEDLGSSNGTYHNGVRIEKEALLQPGDSIQIGPVVFVLQIDGVPADEDLNPITAEAATGAGAAADDVTHADAPYGYAADAGQGEGLETVDTLDTLSVHGDAGHGEASEHPESPDSGSISPFSGDDLDALGLGGDHEPSREGHSGDVGCLGDADLLDVDLQGSHEGDNRLHIDLDEADSDPSHRPGRPQ